MKINSFGCSFIRGTSLSDLSIDGITSRPSQLTWPALISNKLNLDYNCYAGGGRGNLMIVDRLCSIIKKSPQDFFIIQWTYIDRFDYSDPTGRHFNASTNDYLSLRPGETDEISRYYFKNLHSEYKDKLVNLTYINLALDMLQTHRCKFLMTYVDSTLWCSQYHQSPGIEFLQNKLIPHIYDFQGLGFVGWAQKNQFEISSCNHPQAAAHQAAADIMLPIVEGLIRDN